MITDEPRSGVSRQALQCMRATLEDSLVPIAATEGAEHVVRYANAAFCRMAGRRRGEIVHRPFVEVVPADIARGGGALLDVVWRTGSSAEAPAGSNGASPEWAYTAWPILDDGLRPAGVMVQALDVTSAATLRSRTEESADLLREMSQALLLSSLSADEAAELAETAEHEAAEARRLEGIGRLAGGIAHDFNNLLTVILGNASLAEGSPGLGAEVRGHLQEIGKAAERAATLTSQLLSFARKQVSHPRVADLDALIADLASVLRRIAGEDIEIEIRPGQDLGRVRLDAGLFGQLLMNVVVNARDAMPDGGRILIETRNVELSEREARGLPHAVAGPHVLLEVSDDGEGMSDEMKAHAFEPFYAPRGAGKGTGLELATCYGIVEQAGGHVQLVSARGQGTTIRVLLPRVASEPAPELRERASAPTRASELVLLVDDERMVRELAALVLRRQGYEVLEAADGEAALRQVAGSSRPIDVVVTDVVMPRMGGKELASRLATSHPGLPVLFMSGYPAGASVQKPEFEPGLTFLQKPYTPGELVLKVRALLDAGLPRAGG